MTNQHNRTIHRKSFGWGGLLASGLAAALSAGAHCQPTGPSGGLRVDIAGKLDNAADIPASVTLALSYPPGGAGARVDTRSAASLHDLKALSLSIMPAGITTDAAYLQVFTSPTTHVGDPPDNSVVQKGDFDFMRPRTGSVVVLAIDAPNLGSATSVSARLDPSQQGGMAWLARAGLTDATLRWTAPNPCPANLVFPGPGGCFSMSGLVGLLTSSISAAASAGVAGSSTVSFVRVSVVSYIPNLVSTLDKPNRRVRGVGLVFALDLKARIAVDPSSVGLPPLPLGAPAPPIPLSPWHYVTAYIPIALLFESDGANGLQFSLDPFDLAGSLAGSEMINHLAVEVTPVLGDTPVANLIAEAVLNGLPAAGSLPATPGLRSILSTPIAGTTLASNALSGFFTAARARAAPLSSDFEVLLAPAPNGPVGTPVSPALSPLGGLPGVDLVFLESRG